METKATTTKQLENRTPLKLMSVRTHTNTNPQKSPSDSHFPCWSCSSFLIMRAAYETIWWQKTRTRRPSHGWCYERIRNGFTPTQPKKQFKAAGMHQRRNIQPSLRRQNSAGTRAMCRTTVAFNVLFYSISPAYVLELVDQAYKILFFVPLHTLPKITVQIKDTTVVNRQSTRK